MEWKPQNFRLINFQDSSEKGVCYEETKQTWITIHNHKSENDIIITSVEESIHEAIVIINESLNMDMEQEEELVKRLFWFMNDWI